MTSPVLFSTGASPATSGASRNLVEFKAGKMEMRERMVHPIKRQGLVYLRQSADDNLMHFCWKDRQTGIIEDDLILFPDDCEFKRVKECTTGRVFVLKMKSSNKKMFFWMQESKTDRDEEFCKKINDMLNNPPRAGSDISGSSERGLQELFGSMTQEQVTQLLSSNGVNLASLLNSANARSPSTNSGASASSTASTTNSAPHSATSINAPMTGVRESSPSLNDLRALISGALMEGNEDEASALMAATMASQADAGLTSGASHDQHHHHQQQQQQQQQQQSPLIDLSTAINSENLMHLLNDEAFLSQIEPHLPPVDGVNQAQSSLSSEQRIRQFAETIRSSQFRSALSQFSMAIQSGQLGPLMSQFGLSPACVDAANLGNLEAFVRALDEQTKSSGGNNNNPASGGGGNSDQQPPPSSDSNKDKSS